MMHAYDESYLEGTRIKMGDMLEYACLDCGYDPDGFWIMFIQSNMAHQFEVGNPSVLAGKSGPEIAKEIIYKQDFEKDLPEPGWREERSDLFWSGWAIAYYQWLRNVPFVSIWKKISIRTFQKMYRTLHEADISKTVDLIDERLNKREKKNIKTLRLVKGMTQQELADEAGMSLSQLQRLEYGERKCANLSLSSALALSKALGIEPEELE